MKKTLITGVTSQDGAYPKFTVVTPTFNQGQFIEKTIDSVLTQGYPNLEFIIIDGGSKDNTVEIIKKYEHHLAYWVSEPDRGQSHAINKGMAKANGNYLTWLNSDDWYTPDALLTLAQTFQAHPDAEMVVGAGRFVDELGHTIHDVPAPSEITLNSLFSWFEGGNFMQPSGAFSKKAWDAVGQIDENIHIALDVDLWLRIAKAGFKFATTNELLSINVSHPSAKTTAYVTQMDMDCALVILKHGGEKEARKVLEPMANRLAWYEKNYEAIVSNPLLRLLRPIIKRLAKNDQGYWQEAVPPWVKN
jgi:glycosyltransferase involved in cell wall biosynthesis